jgi:hypothetical protein
VAFVGTYVCVCVGSEQDRMQPAAEGARGMAGQPARRVQVQGHRQPPEVPPVASSSLFSPLDQERNLRGFLIISPPTI